MSMFINLAKSILGGSKAAMSFLNKFKMPDLGIKVDVNMDGFWNAIKKFGQYVDEKFGGKSDLTDEVANIALECIREAIDDVGLSTKTGHLKNSFQFTGVEKQGDTYIVRIITTARYASYLNDGTAPSFGRYIPTIGKRLVRTDRSIGIHPGNRPYKYLDLAVEKMSARIGTRCDVALTQCMRQAGL